MLALNKASVVADIGTSGQLWDTPNIELHVYMYVYIYIYCTEASKFKNYYSVKSTVPYRTEKSQERIPEDHRNGARMGLGHASEGGRCVGSLQVLKLLEAEYLKHVRTTNHFR